MYRLSLLCFFILSLSAPLSAQELVVNNLSNNEVYVGICAAQGDEIKMCRYRTAFPLSEESFDLRIGKPFRISTCGLSHKSMNFRSQEGDVLYFALARAGGNVIRPSKAYKYAQKLWYLPLMGERTTPVTYNSQPFSIKHRCSYSTALGNDVVLLSTFHDTVIDWETYYKTGQHTFLKPAATEGFLRTVSTDSPLTGVADYFWNEAVFYALESGKLTFTIKP